jgi:hypothetical protein
MSASAASMSAGRRLRTSATSSTASDSPTSAVVSAVNSGGASISTMRSLSTDSTSAIASCTISAGWRAGGPWPAATTSSDGSGVLCSTLPTGLPSAMSETPGSSEQPSSV